MPLPPTPEPLKSQGYVVLEGIYGPAARAEIGRLLDAVDPGALPAADPWGVEVVPLLERAPGMARWLAHPPLLSALAAALGGAPTRLYDGARFTHRGAGGFLPWHFHADLAGADGRWDPQRPGAPPRIDRVVVTAYLDGATPDNGPLWVFPRAEGDPWRPPHPDPSAPWPGHHTLHLAPGDVAVWDVATFHAAWCRGGPRRIFGGIFARGGA